MKKIKILALLAVLVFIVQDLSDMTRGFSDGWREAKDSTEFFSRNHFSVRVRPMATLVPDTMINNARKERVGDEGKVAFWADAIGADTSMPVDGSLKVVMFLYIPFGLFVFYGIYCLIRLIISVMRGRVFTRVNVRRMRAFVYSVILGMIVHELWGYLVYLQAAECFVIPDYEVIYRGLRNTWLLYLLLALFTEIFAVGVKIKEEQDLTI